MRKQESFHVSNQTIVGGVLIGTALGALTAFLMSNSGRHVRQNLSKMCCDISEQAQDIAHHIAKKSEEVSEQVSERLFNNGNSRHTPQHLNLIIGSIAGGILGISAIAFLTHDSTKDVRKNLLKNFQSFTNKTYKMADNLEETAHDVAENFEEHVTSWVKTAQKFIDTLNGCAKTACEKSHLSEVTDSTVDKVVDWASFGIRLYQSLKK